MPVSVVGDEFSNANVGHFWGAGPVASPGSRCVLFVHAASRPVFTPTANKICRRKLFLLGTGVGTRRAAGGPRHLRRSVRIPDLSAQKRPPPPSAAAREAGRHAPQQLLRPAPGSVSRADTGPRQRRPPRSLSHHKGADNGLYCTLYCHERLMPTWTASSEPPEHHQKLEKLVK